MPADTQRTEERQKEADEAQKEADEAQKEADEAQKEADEKDNEDNPVLSSMPLLLPLPNPEEMPRVHALENVVQDFIEMMLMFAARLLERQEGHCRDHAQQEGHEERSRDASHKPSRG